MKWEARGSGRRTGERLDLLLRATRLFDEAAGLAEGGFYSQLRGVEQDGVGRLQQRGRGPARIPLVALADVGQHLFQRHPLALARQLSPAPLGPNFRARG